MFASANTRPWAFKKNTRARRTLRTDGHAPSNYTRIILARSPRESWSPPYTAFASSIRLRAHINICVSGVFQRATATAIQLVRHVLTKIYPLLWLQHINHVPCLNLDSPLFMESVY